LRISIRKVTLIARTKMQKDTKDKPKDNETAQPTKGKTRIKTIYIALITIWTALLLSTSLLTIYPVPGTPASITFSSVLLSSLSAPLLGPLYGMISGFIFGWLVPFVNPATSVGILTFLAPTLAALMSGLVLFNRWKAATLILACEIAVWLANPFAWYQLMPLILWQYVPVAVFILVPPVRKWIINSIVTLDPKRLPIALWCLAWIARIGGDVATGNNIGVWVLNWTGPGFYPFWAPMTAYYAVADSLNCLAGALIGAGVLSALKRSGIRVTALDALRAKLSPNQIS
jgi:uncharacterized membrane protein